MNDDQRQARIAEIAYDRSQPSKVERSSRRWLPIAAVVVACVVASAAFGVFEFRQQDFRKETTPPPAAQPQASQPPPPSPPRQAATNSRTSGALAASGYVVARRKATVAAEITGKVMEVLIEEGMTVTEGQVVARLDSVLAESDLALARSRVEAADAAIGAISADLQDATRIHLAGPDAGAEEFRDRCRTDQGPGARRRADRATAPVAVGA